MYGFILNSLEEEKKTIYNNDANNTKGLFCFLSFFFFAFNNKTGFSKSLLFFLFVVV